MRVDATKFSLLNVADSCSIWNLLSSRLLYGRALSKGCNFSCTQFVEYECLHKRRTRPSNEDDELKARLTAERRGGRFTAYPLEIDDLQDVEMLRARRALSLGELSSIAFAKKTSQAFLTDDQKARKLAEVLLPLDRIQTVPQLFGWLVFSGSLEDGDKTTIVNEHSSFYRPLSKYFEEVYRWVLEQRLARQSSASTPE